MVSHYFLPSNSECLRRNAKEFAKIFLLVLKINLTVTVTNSNLFYYFNMNFLKDSDLEFSEKKKKNHILNGCIYLDDNNTKLFHMVISYNTLRERSQKRHTLV